MKTKILISLLVIFIFSSCEKEKISSQHFEDAISYKSTPPEFSIKPSKADYELYSRDMFSLAHDVVSYAESQGNFTPVLEWHNSTWEMYTKLYLLENHSNDFDTLMSTFTSYYDEWYSGNVSVELEPWQMEVLNTIQTNLDGLDDDDFYIESMIYLDEVFDSVYAMQGVPPAEMDQTLSSIMIIKGSIEFVYGNTDLLSVPWGWKKIAKCVAGTVGTAMGTGVGGLAAGATIAGYLGVAVATGGASIIISAGVVGAIGGGLVGTIVGGCWD